MTEFCMYVSLFHILQLLKKQCLFLKSVTVPQL